MTSYGKARLLGPGPWVQRRLDASPPARKARKKGFELRIFRAAEPSREAKPSDFFPPR